MECIALGIKWWWKQGETGHLNLKVQIWAISTFPLLVRKTRITYFQLSCPMHGSKERINSPLNTGTPLRALMDQDRNVLKTTAHRISLFLATTYCLYIFDQYEEDMKYIQKTQKSRGTSGPQLRVGGPSDGRTD